VRWLAAFLALAVVTVDARQDWRAPALASFDEAWQTVNETFHDPAFGGIDWQAVRTELRPKAANADTPDAARNAIVEMLARLGQSHFSLLTSSPIGQPLPGDAVVPIDIRVGDDGLIVTRVEDPGLERIVRPGDIVVSVAGDDPVANAEGPDVRARRLDAWHRATRALHGVSG
jgi:carboxyl-terminal processing protease